MYIVITVLIILVCLFLILVVLIQNPKGSGLASGFTNLGNQVMGARKATDVMEKATWYSVITLLVLSLSSGFFIPKENRAKEKQKSEIEDKVNTNIPGLPEGPASSPSNNPGSGE
jgi:preprotein translocase subunit SecG